MRHRSTTPHNIPNARILRRNQTDAEEKLWHALRMKQIEGGKFRRQHPIGSYIVDFCATRQKLIIEVDGSQHLEQQEKEQARTDFLEHAGYRILRFWNNEVLDDIEAVLETIQSELFINRDESNTQKQDKM